MSLRRKVFCFLILRAFRLLLSKNGNSFYISTYGEIDIIVKQDDTTIFVEVKARTSNKMGLPEESITPRKREHMIACAEHYAAEHGIDHWQIDVISIERMAGLTPKVTYFENAV